MLTHCLGTHLSLRAQPRDRSRSPSPPLWTFLLPSGWGRTHKETLCPKFTSLHHLPTEVPVVTGPVAPSTFPPPRAKRQTRSPPESPPRISWYVPYSPFVPMCYVSLSRTTLISFVSLSSTSPVISVLAGTATSPLSVCVTAVFLVRPTVQSTEQTTKLTTPVP